jgi:TolB-like protein/Tfp pilus assembly protein PilF
VFQFSRVGTHLRGVQNVPLEPGPGRPGGASLPLAAPEKSIAVLPFESFSTDKENAFFADGVQDEILTDLAKVADLKVISRSSVMQYKGAASRNLREIAAQLGVVHVVEGSVQRSGQKVRVNAQLIDARTDAHEWAMNYDRPLDDVFAIQSEIAQAIADQLRAKISPEEHAAMMQPPTTDVLAFQFFEQARELQSRSDDPEGKDSLLEAANLLGRAIARDPRFLQAWCTLSMIHLDLYWNGFDHTDARRELAHAALEEAIRLQPDAGETHIARAVYLYHGFREYDRAVAELELARRVLPNSALVPDMLGYIHRRQGRLDETIRELEQSVTLDPRNFGTFQEIGVTCLVLGRDAEAVRSYNRALAIVPAEIFTRELLASVAYLRRADLRPLEELNAAIVAHEPANLERSAPYRLSVALAKRDAAAAQTALAVFPAAGFQQNVNFVMPRDWFAGLTALTFGDMAGAQTALTSARATLEKIVREQPDYAQAWSGLGLVDAGLGRKEDALREGRRACELLPITKEAWDGPALAENLAEIYARTGEKDLALQQLETLAPRHYNGGMTYGELKLDPRWDALRGDPRFKQLVAKAFSDEKQ